MIWAKRRFAYAAYAPHRDRLADLQVTMPANSREFMMVGREVDDEVGLQDIYIGVPNKELLHLFEGFEIVSEGDLPKEIDAFISRTMGNLKNALRFAIFRSGVTLAGMLLNSVARATSGPNSACWKLQSP